MRPQPGDAFRFAVKGINAAVCVDGDDRSPGVVQAEGREASVKGGLAASD
jgi:hypothetical protein